MTDRTTTTRTCDRPRCGREIPIPTQEELGAMDAEQLALADLPALAVAHGRAAFDMRHLCSTCATAVAGYVAKITKTSEPPAPDSETAVPGNGVLQ